MDGGEDLRSRPPQKGGFVDPGLAALIAVLISGGVGGYGYINDTSKPVVEAEKKLRGEYEQRLKRAEANETQNAVLSAEKMSKERKIQELTKALEDAKKALAAFQKKLQNDSGPALTFRSASSQTLKDAIPKFIKALENSRYSIFVKNPGDVKMITDALTYPTEYRAKLEGLTLPMFWTKRMQVVFQQIANRINKQAGGRRRRYRRGGQPRVVGNKQNDIENEIAALEDKERSGPLSDTDREKLNRRRLELKAIEAARDKRLTSVADVVAERRARGEEMEAAFEPSEFSPFNNLPRPSEYGEVDPIVAPPNEPVPEVVPRNESAPKVVPTTSAAPGEMEIPTYEEFASLYEQAIRGATANVATAVDTATQGKKDTIAKKAAETLADKLKKVIAAAEKEVLKYDSLVRILTDTTDLKKKKAELEAMYAGKEDELRKINTAGEWDTRKQDYQSLLTSIPKAVKDYVAAVKEAEKAEKAGLTMASADYGLSALLPTVPVAATNIFAPVFERMKKRIEDLKGSKDVAKKAAAARAEFREENKKQIDFIKGVVGEANKILAEIDTLREAAKEQGTYSKSAVVAEEADGAANGPGAEEDDGAGAGSSASGAVVGEPGAFDVRPPPKPRATGGAECDWTKIEKLEEEMKFILKGNDNDGLEDVLSRLSMGRLAGIKDTLKASVGAKVEEYDPKDLVKAGDLFEKLRVAQKQAIECIAPFTKNLTKLKRLGLSASRGTQKAKSALSTAKGTTLKASRTVIGIIATVLSGIASVFVTVYDRVKGKLEDRAKKKKEEADAKAAAAAAEAGEAKAATPSLIEKLQAFLARSPDQSVVERVIALITSLRKPNPSAEEVAQNAAAAREVVDGEAKDAAEQASLFARLLGAAQTARNNAQSAAAGLASAIAASPAALQESITTKFNNAAAAIKTRGERASEASVYLEVVKTTIGQLDALEGIVKTMEDRTIQLQLKTEDGVIDGILSSDPDSQYQVVYPDIFFVAPPPGARIPPEIEAAMADPSKTGDIVLAIRSIRRAKRLLQAIKDSETYLQYKEIPELFSARAINTKRMFSTSKEEALAREQTFVAQFGADIATIEGDLRTAKEKLSSYLPDLKTLELPKEASVPNVEGAFASRAKRLEEAAAAKKEEAARKRSLGKLVEARASVVAKAQETERASEATTKRTIVFFKEVKSLLDKIETGKASDRELRGALTSNPLLRNARPKAEKEVADAIAAAEKSLEDQKKTLVERQGERNITKDTAEKIRLNKEIDALKLEVAEAEKSLAKLKKTQVVDTFKKAVELSKEEVDAARKLGDEADAKASADALAKVNAKEAAKAKAKADADAKLTAKNEAKAKKEAEAAAKKAAQAAQAAKTSEVPVTSVGKTRTLQSTPSGRFDVISRGNSGSTVDPSTPVSDGGIEMTAAVQRPRENKAAVEAATAAQAADAAAKQAAEAAAVQARLASANQPAAAVGTVGDTGFRPAELMSERRQGNAGGKRRTRRRRRGSRKSRKSTLKKRRGGK